ncbi:MAG: hypothetical protein HWQ38_33705 [Nostoc sp. NMS7]|uniref:hypothetical protein n=1 Tax=Nostoc sp. NMS7 TaxID=2815391 RepID=UPI0025DFAE02|nr:hypothetical protein [Nostoc sp. NMS7]MBN3951160.1 hypothetical protein [Nostoc sp. NMS7]
MTDTAVSISLADIQTLEQLYTFRERTEVLEFLDKHPFLIPVLLEAPEKIRHYFPDSQLFLEVVPDPEIIDYVLLVLSILMKLDPDDAIARQKQMDLDWWLNSTTHEVRSQFITLLEYPDEF